MSDDRKGDQLKNRLQTLNTQRKETHKTILGMPPVTVLPDGAGDGTLVDPQPAAGGEAGKQATKQAVSEGAKPAPAARAKRSAAPPPPPPTAADKPAAKDAVASKRAKPEALPPLPSARLPSAASIPAPPPQPAAPMPQPAPFPPAPSAPPVPGTRSSGQMAAIPQPPAGTRSSGQVPAIPQPPGGTRSSGQVPAIAAPMAPAVITTPAPGAPPPAPALFPAALPPQPQLIDGAPLPLHSPPSGPMPHAGALDAQVTTKRPLLEATPPPLPPTPASADAELYFEEAPTRPSALSDIAPSGTGRTPSPFGTHSGVTPAAGKGRSPVTDHTDVVSPLRPPRPPTDASSYSLVTRRPWLIPALAAAVALVVGLALGAAMFGGGDDRPAATATPAAAPAECPPTQVTVPAPIVLAVLPAPAPDPAAVPAAVPTAAPTPAGDSAKREVKPRPEKRAVPKPARVKLDVLSSPRGATVFVGGRSVGKTPLSTDVAAGKTSVKVVLAGYKPYEQTVTAKAGAPVKVAAALVKTVALPKK